MERGISTTLLRGLLVLRHFDANEIAAYADIDLQTALSFLSAHVDWLEAPTASSASGRWKLRAEFVSVVRGLANASTAVQEDRVLTAVPANRAGQASVLTEPLPIAWDSETEEYYDLAMAMVQETEADPPFDGARRSRDSGAEDCPEDCPEDTVAAVRIRTSKIEAASMYLARCEATLWPLQARRLVLDEYQVARLRNLRGRIENLRLASSAVGELAADVGIQHALQDWSESLPRSLSKLNILLPDVLRTFTAEDLANWIAGDLGLSTPWHQAAARATELKRLYPLTWPDVEPRLVAHCMEVLRLPSCSTALASISMLAATLEARELTRPLVAALLRLNAPNVGSTDASFGRAAQDCAIVQMALSRLCQAPRLASKVHLEAALACELLLAGASDKDYEHLAPAVMLRAMVQELPWVDRAVEAGRHRSAIFYRNLVKAIFIAARSGATRTSLSHALASRSGQALVAILFDKQAAHRHDSVTAHLMVPCGIVQRSLEEDPSPDQIELDQLQLELQLESGSKESIDFIVAQGLDNFGRAMAGELGGHFSKGLSARGMTPALNAMLSSR